MSRALMRSAHITIAMFCCMYMAPGQLHSENEQLTLYFLRDDQRHMWCGYSNQSEWKKSLNVTRADIYGGVEYRNGLPYKVLITVSDSTGDWAVNDEYDLNRGLEIESLKRKISYIPENEREEQVFRIDSGRARKVRSVLRNLGTDEVTAAQHPIYELASQPVVTSIRQFGFYPILGRRETVWTSGRVCLSDSP